ncbi:hypothetical protein ACLOJK_026121 [Asimina triloba]
MVSVLVKDLGIDARSAIDPSPSPCAAVRGEVSGGIGRGMMSFRASECGGIRPPCFDAVSGHPRKDEFKSGVSSDFGSGGAGRKSMGRVSADEEALGLHVSSKVGRADGDDGRRWKNGVEAAEGQIACQSSSLTRRRFEFGDMLWAKVESHPWWPGYIFDEAFASPSVRSTRIDGHVLVAFFGDSSYGWFNPAELIPFDAHYAEMSRLTTSRDFRNAVDEAVDEVRRRSSLGLACRCRNPFNFRPASVKGYSMVDLDYFEPGGIYTTKQINNSRGDFQPVDMLSFLQKLALNPRGSDTSNYDWIKRTAAVIAYRRAVFEEFDVTYALAFGVEPILPTRNAMGVLELPNRVLPRVVVAWLEAEDIGYKRPLDFVLVGQKPRIPISLLSGLLVKPKGRGKKSSQPVKSKNPLKKKDKYLFKKREGVNEAQVATARPSVDGYVLQERLVVAKSKSDGRKLAVADVSLVNRHHSGAGIVLPTSAAVVLSSNQAAAAHSTVPATGSGGSEDGALQSKFGISEKNVLQEMSGRTMLDGAFQPMNKDTGGSSSMMAKLESSETGQEERHDQTRGDVHFPSGTSRLDGLIERKKRPREDTVLEMREKRKRKKDLTLEARRDDQVKHAKTLKDTEALGKSSGKPIGIISEQSSELSSKPLVSVPELQIGSMRLEMPELMNDLLTLAVDPSHGIEFNAPAIAKEVFLKFRSLVYKKSSVLPPTNEPETLQPEGNSDGEKLVPELGIGNTNIKPLKQPLRPDDPTKSGQKRSSSDRQEEMSVKRKKRLNDIKAMAATKKVPPPSIEMKQATTQKGEKKDSPPVKLNKPELQGSSATPTSLMMKFPPRTSLPSIPHLKAKFARFGQIDHDATRVYWNTWMCKVVFKFKADAQAAYNHAIQSKSLFGPVEVSYRLRELELPAPEVSEESKQPAEDTPDASQLFKPVRTDLGGEPPRAMLHQQQGQPAVQLKSCLKKTPPTGAHTVGPIKEGPRVKFQIGGDQNSSISQKVAVGVGNDIAGKAPNKPSLLSSSSTSSMALDFSSTDTKQTVHNPPLELNFSHPDLGVNSSDKPHQSKHLPLSELAKRNNNVDISRQMVGLLIKCNDIVTDLKNKLGYMPYHVL